MTYDYMQRKFQFCGYCGRWRKGDNPLDTKKYPDLSHWHRPYEPDEVQAQEESA